MNGRADTERGKAFNRDTSGNLQSTRGNGHRNGTSSRKSATGDQSKEGKSAAGNKRGDRGRKKDDASNIPTYKVLKPGATSCINDGDQNKVRHGLDDAKQGEMPSDGSQVKQTRYNGSTLRMM
jgi:hypothetical protein